MLLLRHVMLWFRFWLIKWSNQKLYNWNHSNIFFLKRCVHSNRPPVPSKANGYQCKFCDKKFSGRCNLKEHVMKDHEKSTPFHCEQCTRSFGTSSFLKAHVHQVHRRVKCDECGQEMCNTFILKRHKAKVHGIKDVNEHQCKHCHLSFKLKDSFFKHMIKIHPEVKFLDWRDFNFSCVLFCYLLG